MIYVYSELDSKDPVQIALNAIQEAKAKGYDLVIVETAVDKQGKIATLNQLTYSPVVNTSLIVINRYYDKKYLMTRWFRE